MIIAFAEGAPDAISTLHSPRYTEVETQQRKVNLYRELFSTLESFANVARVATEGKRKGSRVIHFDQYWVFFSFSSDQEYLVIEAVYHSRQMAERPY